MKTFVIEREYLEKGTIGIISSDGLKLHTVERPKTGENPCIEEGWYIAERYFSPANNCIVWLLKDVPGRTMIELHVANWPHELKGCIAPGTGMQISPEGDPGVTNSRIAFHQFMDATKDEEQIAFQIVSKDGNKTV